VKRASTLTILLGTFAVVTFASAQCMCGSGEMKAVCMRGGEMEMGCCGMTGHDMKEPCADRFYLCCAEDLGLSDEQVKRLKAIQLEHRKSTVRMRADLEVMELELADLLEQPTPVRSAIDGKITAMCELRAQMRKGHIHARLDATSVLSKEQLERRCHGSCGKCGAGKQIMGETSCSTSGKKCDRTCK